MATYICISCVALIHRSLQWKMHAQMKCSYVLYGEFSMWLQHVATGATTLICACMRSDFDIHNFVPLWGTYFCK